MKPKQILDPKEYRNYRNVRAIGLWFAILGGLLALGGVACMSGKQEGPDQISPAVAVALSAVGLVGSAGGIAVRMGNRRWAPLAYVMGGIYVLCFPLGTLLSCVLFNGLSRYLDSADRVRQARMIPV